MTRINDLPVVVAMPDDTVAFGQERVPDDTVALGQGPKVAVEAKHDVLLQALCKFYEDDAYFQRFRDVVTGNSPMSLRVLDWLVTNYAKKHHIVYNTQVRGRETTVIVFFSYRSQLKSYNKKLFDPFCRRERIEYRGITTTVGQLNFFRWAMLHGVLDYAFMHHDEIERDMLESIQHRASNAALGLKRKELSKAAIGKMTVTSMTVRLALS